MTDPLEVVEIILIFQLIKGRVKHFSLFLNIAISIMVIFKADNDEWFIIILPYLSRISNFATVIYLNF